LGHYAVPAGEWKGQPIPDIGEWIMNGKSSDPSDPPARYVGSKIGRITIDTPGVQRLVLGAEDEEAQQAIGLALQSVRMVPIN
jgi:hypothetical protein